MSVTEFSPVHLIVLLAIAAAYLASIWAIVVTVRDRRYPVSEKIIWCLELILFPLLGLIVWLVARAFRRALA